MSQGAGKLPPPPPPLLISQGAGKLLQYNPIGLVSVHVHPAVHTQTPVGTQYDIIQMCSGITCDRVLNGELYTQRFQKLIYRHLFTDCFMKIFAQLSEQIQSDD